MTKLLSIIFISLLLPTATFAYLEPTEVFTDLEIPENTDQDSEQNIAAPTQALPVFYRGGEPLEQTAEPDAAPEGIFEQEPIDEPLQEEEFYEDAFDDSTIEEEDMMEEEEDMMEEEEMEEEIAPKEKGSSIVGFMKKSIYLFVGIGLAAAGALYYAMSKKKSGGTATPTQKGAPPEPDNPQKVEESSPRLEHALKAMEEDEGKEEK